MWRSVVSIVVAYAVWSAMWLALGAGLRALRPGDFDDERMTESAGMLLTFLGGSIVISLVSGFIAARIARRRVLRSALILGVLLLGTGIGVQTSVWASMPLWYHLGFLALLIPGVLLGAAMRPGGVQAT